MSAPEINVEIVNPPVAETTEESGAPEVVVVETAAPSGGTDPGTILSLEMLRDQMDGLRADLTVQTNIMIGLQESIDSLRARVADMEVEEEIEVAETGEIVAEVIPAVTVAETESEAPRERKRKFI